MICPFQETSICYLSYMRGSFTFKTNLHKALTWASAAVGLSPSKVKWDETVSLWTYRWQEHTQTQVRQDLKFGLCMGQEFILYLSQIVWCPHMFDAEPISSHPAAPCVANAGRANVQAGPAPGFHRISSSVCFESENGGCFNFFGQGIFPIKSINP